MKESGTENERYTIALSSGPPQKGTVGSKKRDSPGAQNSMYRGDAAGACAPLPRLHAARRRLRLRLVLVVEAHCQRGGAAPHGPPTRCHQHAHLHDGVGGSGCRRAGQVIQSAGAARTPVAAGQRTSPTSQPRAAASSGKAAMNCLKEMDRAPCTQTECFQRPGRRLGVWGHNRQGAGGRGKGTECLGG